MEKIYDFLNELKTRVSSPFFSSYVISWGVINWKIPIGLIFYNQSELNADGFDSYFDLIEKNFGVWKSIIIPFLSASVYSFLYPWVRNQIMMSNTYFNTKGITKSLEISGGGKLPVNRFIALSKKYREATKALEENIEYEREAQDKYGKMLVDYQTLQDQYNTLSNDVEITKNINNVAFIRGSWQWMFRYNKAIFNVSISGDNFIFLENAPFDYQSNSVIVHYSNDIKANMLFLTLSVKHKKGDDIVYFIKLSYKEHLDVYYGTVNNEIPIELKRISPNPF